MGEVYVYDKWTEDFSTTGLCGVLTPFSCRHEEIAGGMSAVTLEHPFDDLGRWKHIQRGNVLKCLCRVRTTPEILNGQVVTAVEVWTVLDTATKAQRGVYTKAEKGRRKATLKPGVQVTVVQKGTSRYKIKSGKVTGWIAQEAHKALETLDGEPVEFYDGEDPEHLSLCYMELIAPLVAGYQAQQARIGRLEARLSRLEGKSYAEPGP